jgi:hypothetical protein
MKRFYFQQCAATRVATANLSPAVGQAQSSIFSRGGWRAARGISISSFLMARYVRLGSDTVSPTTRILMTPIVPRPCPSYPSTTPRGNSARPPNQRTGQLLSLNGRYLAPSIGDRPAWGALQPDPEMTFQRGNRPANMYNNNKNNIMSMPPFLPSSTHKSIKVRIIRAKGGHVEIRRNVHYSFQQCSHAICRSRSPCSECS